jgi:D-3-phosphoglycerate dehydrogenase
LDLQNVIITPHLAGAANDVKRHHGRMVLDDLDRLRRGVRPTHLANPAVWNSS